MRSVSPFAALCGALESLLSGSLRRDLAGELAAGTTLGGALHRLRPAMRSHAWMLRDHLVDLSRSIEKLDRKTRQVGFHVLNDWDGIADRVNEEIIPVDVLDYLVDRRGHEPADPVVLAILIDYYFMHLLALVAVRVWDDGDPDGNLARVDVLLGHLQGPQGSGQLFAADAATLLLIATSHYEMHERGYAVLLDRVRSLCEGQQTRIALGHAVAMGCHLRFGFEATYARDTITMRDDNVADYPWLLFAVATLMREYVRLRETGAAAAPSEAIVEALANGLSCDARALVGRPPASLAAHEEERARFRDAFHAYRRDLLDAFEPYRPTERAYSPLSFFFNFSHNVVKGAVIDALLEKRAWPLTLNDLLTSHGETGPQKTALATTLMEYARANPQMIRGRLMPVIVYDPQKGRQAFSVALRKLRED